MSVLNKLVSEMLADIEHNPGQDAYTFHFGRGDDMERARKAAEMVAHLVLTPIIVKDEKEVPHD